MRIEEVILKIRNGEIKKGDVLFFDTNKSRKNEIEYDGEHFIAKWTINKLDFLEIYSLEEVMDMDFKLYETVTIGNLELRGTDFTRHENSPFMNAADTLEIVIKEEMYCRTIGYWMMTEMGYDFRFVGDRFLIEDIDIYDLYNLIEEGQKITQQMFKEKNNG